MKSIASNSILFLMTLLVMAGVFEALCRTVIDSGMQYHIEMWKYAVQLKRVAGVEAIGHEHMPNTRAHLMGVDVVINNDGLRNADTELNKAAGTKRILMLGDSITFGWGVPSDQTMSSVMEDMIEAVRGGPVDVINAGVGNYNTSMEVAYFLHKGRLYEPDVVVLNYFINDAEPTPVYGNTSWIARHSYAYAVVGGAWDGLRRQLLGDADWREYYSGLYAPDATGWRATKTSIAALADYCRQHDIKLIVANIPELRELVDYPFAGITREVEKVVEDVGVEFVDLMPAVAGKPARTLWVTEPDPHPNSSAHNLMGTYLSDYVLSSGYLN